jgi:hypothetical protein
MHVAKTFIIGSLVILSTGFVWDAPSEEFYVAPKKIHPQASKEVQGVLSIKFLDLGYSMHFSPQPAKIQGYHRKEAGTDSASLVLSIKNIKALSGVNYEQMIIRRFPITAIDGGFCQIVYDVEKNLRIWVQIVDNNYVRTSVGQLVPANAILFADSDQVGFAPDIFYLLDGKRRRFYKDPKEDAPYFDVQNEDQINDIPFRSEKEFVSLLEVTAVANGYAKISTRSGVDGEAKFAGWIKLFENGRLTVWPVAGSGC